MEMFVFDVLNNDGTLAFTLEKEGDFFNVRYPSGMTHDEKQRKAVGMPYPIYDGCAYEMNQLAIMLNAFSAEQYQRFLIAYEKAQG